MASKVKMNVSDAIGGCKMNEFIVYPKRGRMLMLAILAFVFVLLGTLFLGIYFVEEEVSFGILLVGIISILFFGLCMIFYIKEMIIRKPMLIVSDEGITDRSSLIGAGLVRWEDIADIDFISFGGQLFLGIFTHDPNLIINRTGRFTSMLNKLNKGLIDAQVNIPVKSLDCDQEELVEIINSHWEKAVENTEIK